MICGAGPFVRVSMHAKQKHGIGRTEYKRLYPGALLTDPSFVPWFADLAAANGVPAATRRRRRYCKRGHALRGSNVFYRKNGSRICRRCKNERNKRATCECGAAMDASSTRCKACRLAAGWMSPRAA